MPRSLALNFPPTSSKEKSYAARYTRQERDTNTQPDRADLIAAVLAHPDTPAAITDALTDAICNLWHSTEIYEDARPCAPCSTITRGAGERKGGAR